MPLKRKDNTFIIQLITSINLGGAENVALSLVENCQDKLGSIEFVLAELYSSENNYANQKKEKLKELGINIKTLCHGSKRLSLFLAPFSLFKLIKNLKPDIIHSHTDLPDFVLATTIHICRIFQVKVPRIIRSIHNTELWSTHSMVGRYVESSFRNDTIVGVSPVALNAYKKLRIKNKLKISSDLHIIYNGCKIPKKESFGFTIDNNKINILFCGRFEKQKGIDILLKRLVAINRLYESKINFYFIGSGSYQSHLIDISKNYSNIQLFSPIVDIANKLSSMDFLIMPSRFEGMVLLSLESSLAKVPVIAARAPGLSETLPGDWPLNFDLEEEKSLMKIFKNIIDNKYDINYLKNKSFSFVQERFSYDNMTKNYSNIYSNKLN